MLLHCLYLHLFREDQEDRRLWNLACDIAVEQIISRERSRFWRQAAMRKKYREKVFHILGDRSDSAEKICRKLKEQAFPFHLEELEEAFHFDDHTLWDTCTGEKGKKNKGKNGTSFFPILPQTVRITGNGGEVRKGTRRKRQER